MIEIDGPLWFTLAILICGAHFLFLRSWRRDQRQLQAWWRSYDVAAESRHQEFMSALEDDVTEWKLHNRERGQA